MTTKREWACKHIRMNCSKESPTLQNCIACLKQRDRAVCENTIYLHKKDIEKLRKIIRHLQALEK
jgi:hypothetical protein